MISWEIHGFELANCNCDSGCPCQFMSPPTKGYCEAAVGLVIERGFHGDTDLSGLRVAQMYKWPGAVHEGDGTMQTIIDDSAGPAQRAAIERIVTGQDTDDMATFWWVFAAMSPTRLPTIFRPVTIELDFEARTGTVKVPGVFDSVFAPLVNPVSGAEHRARINLPHGFEYRIAEVAKGTTRAVGALELPGNQDSHAHFCELHMCNSGVLDAA
ncbi:DUF1326 domain-containing protein [Frigidibacter sp. MR17.24]|uniref:DUF1326 domain-containing protein n=1 Tax=Frigidibacter sp. MR17.24 TaxID=3127345 RepID=UPI003012F8B2